MAAKKPMKHLFIFLPGIMGSRLQKNGKDIWSLSRIPFWQHLRALLGAGSIPDLTLRDDDWQHDLNDGVVATELIADLHAVPRVVTQAGYEPFRQGVRQFFDVVEGSIHQPVDKANFYTFPYDWRRDNRATARKLGQFIEQQLPRWRAASGNPQAKVVLIGHSMGGLVARYYVEALDGWRTCHSLITIGTPHWGSVDAVDAICNSKKIGLADFTPVVRTLTSTHQLLPVYKAITLDDGQTVRIGEADLSNLERARAAAARDEFHEVIWERAKANRANPDYATQTVPWVGVEQDTLQSVRRTNGQVLVGYGLPPGFEGQPGDGDGTVPRFSAIPPDMKDIDGRFAVEQHGWLTNNNQTISPVLETIVTLIADLPLGGLGAGRPVPSINLRVAPLVDHKDGPQISVRLGDVSPKPRVLSVVLQRIDAQQPDIKTQVTASGGAAADVSLPQLPAGLYTIEVKPRRKTESSPAPVHAVFEVAEGLERDTTE
jgi:hypothetical protein